MSLTQYNNIFQVQTLLKILYRTHYQIPKCPMLEHLKMLKL